MTDFPPTNHSPNEQKKTKKPEFIILDDTQDFLYTDTTQRKPYAKEEFFKVSDYRSSWAVRFLCFFGMLFAIFIALAATISVISLFLLATLLLFQNQAVNQKLKTHKALLFSSWIVSLGLALALFSPTLGIGFILLYFSLGKDSANSALIKKLLKRFL